MKWITLLVFLPLIEAPIEVWFEKVKKISVTHFWTAVGRGILMIIISLILWKANATWTYWTGALLSAAIFIAFFNYLYNILSGRKLKYLRNAGIDLWIKEHIPFYGQIIYQIIILGIAIQWYFRVI